MKLSLSHSSFFYFHQRWKNSRFTLSEKSVARYHNLVLQSILSDGKQSSKAKSKGNLKSLTYNDPSLRPPRRQSHCPRQRWWRRRHRDSYTQTTTSRRRRRRLRDSGHPRTKMGNRHAQREALPHPNSAKTSPPPPDCPCNVAPAWISNERGAKHMMGEERMITEISVLKVSNFLSVLQGARSSPAAPHSKTLLHEQQVA